MKYIYDLNENGYIVVLDESEFQEKEVQENETENEKSVDDIENLRSQMLSNNLAQSEKISFSDDLDDLDVVSLCLLLLLVLVGAHYVVRGA